MLKSSDYIYIDRCDHDHKQPKLAHTFVAGHPTIFPSFYCHSKNNFSAFRCHCCGRSFIPIFREDEALAKKEPSFSDQMLCQCPACLELENSSRLASSFGGPARFSRCRYCFKAASTTETHQLPIEQEEKTGAVEDETPEEKTGTMDDERMGAVDDETPEEKMGTVDDEKTGAVEDETPEEKTGTMDDEKPVEGWSWSKKLLSVFGA